MPFNIPHGKLGRCNLIIACTGSVAAIKVPQLLQELDATNKFNIILLPSHTSLSFFDITIVPESITVFHDSEEWKGWTRGDPILHIELRKWADILLIAPLSAHTLAKIAAGLSDTLLLEVLRAWDYAKGHVLFAAPAMNTEMYTHPFTAAHLRVLSDLGFQFIGPITKLLACGDVGNGAMSEVTDIVARLESAVIL